jgi:Protein of unknown function (DUF1559)
MIELLVVIAIIGILVGILLPAVQSAREAARFTQCRNHLKQLSLGVHLHESQYRYFPDGGLDWFSDRSMTNGVPNISPKQNWGWMYQILPFIEESVIYAETSDDVVKAQPITLYFCPSRRSAAKVFHQGEQRALNDYAANGGVQASTGPYWGNGTTGGFLARSRHSPQATPASILDGLSNTLMLGEKSVNYQFYHVVSCAGNEGWTAGWDWDTIRWGNVPPVHDRNAEPCQSWFGSVHQGGCLFAFGDGSVHTINYSIDENLFQSLSHCDDREPVSFSP